MLLVDKQESRVLPIMIGESEATAILLALHAHVPRVTPSTFD
ncbi:MAG: hypothetical protein WA571_07100 [Candidatus Binatus sp.]